MRIVLAAAFSLIVTLPVIVQAQSATDLGRMAVQTASPAFTDQDRREIDDWLRLGRRILTGDDDHKSKKMPPGLAKRDHLPPGLAKRDTLPPGLAKRDLPGDLERRLSRLPKGYGRKTVGDDIILIEEATGIIFDILKGAARR
ncbi:LWamide neuropeptides (fragment) [Magnetospirillum gryphiswaldense]|uniref:LWamide neuropeptides n=2 Tax=Magnetospirillum gryphiswaldense TaxID=55518 RepID=V6EY16_MAGGM